MITYIKTVHSVLFKKVYEFNSLSPEIFTVNLYFEHLWLHFLFPIIPDYVNWQCLDHTFVPP